MFLFFFNDTATTEIDTYDTLVPYTTLFRSPGAALVHTQRTLGGDRCQPVQQSARAQVVDVGERAEEEQTLDAAGEADQVEQEPRSEEHTSDLQSLMRTSYAVFCLKKTNNPQSINMKRTETIK